MEEANLLPNSYKEESRQSLVKNENHLERRDTSPL